MLQDQTIFVNLYWEYFILRIVYKSIYLEMEDRVCILDFIFFFSLLININSVYVTHV